MPPSIRSAEFWDTASLRREAQRVFEICHSCRLCYALCPSFQYLFRAIDDREGQVSALSAAELARVSHLCYHCQLCLHKCPYAPPHEWDLDFPRLMLRHKLVEKKREGRSLGDMLLSRVDTTGRLMCLFSSWVNRVNRWPFARSLMQSALGLHRQRQLPPYARQRFSRWFASWPSQRKSEKTSVARVALFFTCTVEYNYPEIGRACVEVLAHNGAEVICPPQRCCGMPYLDAGDYESAAASARFNLRHLLRLVDQGFQVVSLQPTCTLMLRREYPFLLESAEAQRLSQNTYDISDFLMRLQARGQLKRDFAKGAGKVLYHLPCHYKALQIGFKSRDLLRLLPQTQVTMVDRCAGVDGLWGLKTEFFDLSRRVAEKLTAKVAEMEADLVVSDCPLARLQIEQETGKIPKHPIEVIRSCYGEHCAGETL